MKHSRESLIGAGPSPGDSRANVPISTRGDTWYLHALPALQGPIELRYVQQPEAVTLLRTGDSLNYTYDGGILKIEIPKPARTGVDDVIAVQWKENPWEKAVRSFEEQDRQQTPPAKAVLFVGSSTIRMWDLKKHFPEIETINRGFGGSQLSDVARFVDRIILPYHPKSIVLYAGDNDVAGGKSPEWVFADFQAVIAAIQHGLPDTRIIVLSIKPSVARWEKYDNMRQANALIADFAKQDPHMTFFEMGACLLGSDGKPRPELFLPDGLHLNAQGYELWTAILKPLLGAEPERH
jgi:lysophospholipase L1-like esterase